MQSLVAACRDGRIGAEVAYVLSDRADAPGLAWAQQQGIDTRVVERSDYSRREDFEQALAERSTGADLIALAGFMRVLGPGFVTPRLGKIINIHPSLLPDYKGLDTHQRVLAAKELWHGASVHFVDTSLDGGPLIAQERLPVHPQDSPESLAQRVLEIEHRLYPAAVQSVFTGAAQYC